MPRKRGAKKPVHLPAIATRKRRRATPRKNPGIADGLLSNASDALLSSGLVHAFGGYASARLLGRVMRRLVAKKWPDLAKHATPLGNLLACIAIYFTVKKWRKIREEAMIGASIAVVQAGLQTYLPGLAAVFLDSDVAIETAAARGVAAPAGQDGLEGLQLGRRRRKFVLPGEVEAARAEAHRGAPAETVGPVVYVNPGVSAPSGDSFEDATADIGVGDDGDGLGDDDLGIFQNP